MTNTDRDTPVTALREALTDLTAAYHHERRHEGRWRQCQHPRCQNARLAMENRGPFASDTDDQNFGADDIPLASSDDVAGSGERLDVERLARALQETILTSIDEYRGPGMGAYRIPWDALTERQRRHVRQDAEALVEAYEETR